MNKFGLLTLFLSVLFLVGCAQTSYSTSSSSTPVRQAACAPTAQAAPCPTCPYQTWQPYTYAPTNRLILNKEIYLYSDHILLSLPNQCLDYKTTTGNSMMPFYDGAMLVVNKCIKPDAIDVGDMVVFTLDQSITHQVISISPDRKIFTLRGFNQEQSMTQKISPDQIDGVVIAVLY